jgi:hypothetical protein
MSDPLNETYFTNATSAVNGASTCAELQALVNRIIPSINAQQAAITAQLAFLEPLQALLSPPATPDAVVTWVSSFITSYLTPQLAAYATYVAKQTAFTAQLASLTTAIATKAAGFASCTITIPGGG